MPARNKYAYEQILQSLRARLDRDRDPRAGLEIGEHDLVAYFLDPAEAALARRALVDKYTPVPGDPDPGRYGVRASVDPDGLTLRFEFS
jgi:hypothetical protein